MQKSWWFWVYSTDFPVMIVKIGPKYYGPNTMSQYHWTLLTGSFWLGAMEWHFSNLADKILYP